MVSTKAQMETNMTDDNMVDPGSDSDCSAYGEGQYQLLRMLEALLFARAEPASLRELSSLMPDGANLPQLLEILTEQYANRGVNLVCRDGLWAFRTAADLAGLLRIEQEVPRRLSRAALETLAIIAYHQPVTRAEIEEIRGVALSKGTLDTLLEIGWIKPKGHRPTPGRPVTWVVTELFFDHFGLSGTDALPGIEELKAAGLLEKGAAATVLGAGSLLSNPALASENDTEEGDEADREPLNEAELLAEHGLATEEVQESEPV